MATAKTRINVTLPDAMRDVLVKLARKERIPAATKAAKLLETALELEEDHAWDSLAQKRDTKKARYISHNKAWK